MRKGTCAQTYINTHTLTHIMSEKANDGEWERRTEVERSKGRRRDREVERSKGGEDIKR